MKQCKHKWTIQDKKMTCSHCNKVNDEKCNYCNNDGLYLDFKDGKYRSVCFKHLNDHTS